MKKALIFGAGNIGRGFIGQLLSESGYKVVFVDIDNRIVTKMNTDNYYPIRVVSESTSNDIIVNNIRAVNALDIENVIDEIVSSDIMATAVGVNVLSKLIFPIFKGLKKRWANNNFTPLNIIICENLIDSNYYLKNLIVNELNDLEKNYLENCVGFVQASVGRMVPIMTSKMQEGNILRVYVEEYCILPLDRDGFKGEIPEIVNIVPYSPFDYYIKRKLFIHNMGHAITGYFGYLKGYHYIWEAIRDKNIYEISRSAMMESAQALSKEYSVEIVNLKEYVDDLLRRFGNSYLKDTIERVGKDIQRKLLPNDRLIGAFNLCIKNNIEPKEISQGIVAALRFKDPLKSYVTSMINENRIEDVLEKVCGFSKGTKEWNNIMNAIQNFEYFNK